MSLSLNRRTLLAGGLASGALLAAGCSSSGGPDLSGAQAVDESKFPTYRQVTLAEPDLPGSDLVMPAYFTYPTDPAPAYDSPPAAELDHVSILYNTFVPVPLGPDRNSFWQLAQEGTGTELRLQATPNGEYEDKFAVIMASGDIPDVMSFNPAQARSSDMIDSLFADLGPHLSGDAALDYPHLANIPTPSWRAGVRGEKVFGIPQPRALTGEMTYIREDLFEAAGLNPEPTNGEEFLQLLRDIKATGNNQWGWSNVGRFNTTLLQMMKLPQSWGVNDDGTFTSVYTLPEYREALAITRQAFVDGLFHPNAASATYSQFRDHFYAGQTWMLSDGSAGWDLFERTIGDRGTLGAIALPAWDGDGDAGQYAGKGYQLVTTISNKASEDRLPLILKVLDYFAAPIGSLEHLQRKFGQEGTDFTWEANGPRLTEVGQGNFMDFQYFIDSPTILGPGDEEAVRRQHEWHSRVSENLVHDPSIGLVSETQINKGGPLATMITDAVNAVVYDRGPIEDFDSALTKWRNDGGDQIAEEFATAYAERDDA